MIEPPSQPRPASPAPARPSEFVEALRGLRVWDPQVSALPLFDPAAAPADPVSLFASWFGEVVAAGEVEPHTMSLATADTEGRPDVRTVMLHDVDARGWHFASHAGSRKGRHLAARPYASLGFYWPLLGRQVRVRGRVTVEPAEVAHADLHARSTGALAAALVGRQSEVLSSYEELERASEAAWTRAEREPDVAVPSWTAYVVEPDEVEFFQGDARRRHVRLDYRREGGGWVTGLLWP
ncbi:pyridoxine/pyridoxamine 5'-phosphate oxidase [Streptomyces europaeiscabiei]|uniref:Pyridoxal 5'-phosphate synthase n=1 Tax=Streptomyces europaeiscabiei TaxID=146819 RepID=A0ABU4NKG5_9ACTN|nr:pyridoxal 5'-phosphate synthase [Streptomyces europaeiscabiei]MDX2522687.1 pyridoxal 5'-phosphate synthase [Streptomyces europaeiscabiei]MDX3544493.1 pyridoxal 5'-phosphate synthase [Streptomyces europaeiscabiei]MDX3553842.1 pyridoxal 5'-phosphate synthase [Streptomyces europaeiscabiei]MDX3670126.1 pyridoxal 5'-phosphate synthase [Streptomyces europaeiscabiei]MDX3701960.1 pyridoxal 5'-phosphate synthase [Streptomyces europaeiscabiei]